MKYYRLKETLQRKKFENSSKKWHYNTIQIKHQKVKKMNILKNSKKSMKLNKYLQINKIGNGMMNTEMSI